MGWTNPNTLQVQPITVQGSVTGAPVTTLPPGGNITLVPTVDVSGYASYDMNMYGYAVNPGASGSVVAFQVYLQWFDDYNSDIPVFEEDWWLWAGSAPPALGENYVSASGPMHGRYMQVTVILPLTLGNGLVLQYFNVFGSPRPVPYSDWRQNAFLTAPATSGLSVSQSTLGTGFDNILGSWSNVNIPANAKMWVPLSLYAGPCYYDLIMPSNAAAFSPVIASVNNLASGQITVNPSPNVLVNFANTKGLNQSGTFIAPRAPTFLVVQGGTLGTLLSFSVVAQQSA